MQQEKAVPDHNPPATPPAARAAEDFGWGLIQRFDADEAASRLLSEDRAFAGERETIFIGLCAWCLAPSRNSSDTKLVRQAMKMLALSAFSRIEAEKAEKTGSRSLVYAALPDRRLQPVMLALFGNTRLARAAVQSMSRSAHRRVLRTRAANMGRLILLMKILDFHVRNLLPSRPSYGVPSAKKGALVVADLLEKSDREIQNTWLPWRPSCAMLYAASMITIEGKGTLLDLIADDRAVYSQVKHLIPKWLGYARRITDSVLRQVDFQEAWGQIPTLKRIPAVEAPPPDLTEPEQEAVKKVFRRKNAAKTKPLNRPASG